MSCAAAILPDTEELRAWTVERIDYRSPEHGHYVIEHVAHKDVYTLRWRPSPSEHAYGWEDLGEHESQLAAMLAASIDIHERALERATNTLTLVDIDW